MAFTNTRGRCPAFRPCAQRPASGNDFKIMYFVLNDALSAADFAKDMINQFGRENAKVVDANATMTRVVKSRYVAATR